MKTVVVTTTISVPTFFIDYQINAREFGHSNVQFVVVGDQKSHKDTANFCDWRGYTYLDIPTQREYMRRFPALMNHLPLNSVERRNIGMLWAYEQGADVIITLDDDNFATGDDMIGCHQIVGTSPELRTYGSDSGWFNVCSLLQETNGVEFHHRGYSPSHKWKNPLVHVQRKSNKIVVNAGFWLEDPDIDAVTRLERKLEVIGHWYGDINIAIAPGTWTPFDCQNTALAREVIPAYFLSPYIGRHSDIFASYVIMRLTEHFGHSISFGSPWARHHRQPHDLWKDLGLEREGMQLTDSFCDALLNIPIKAANYHVGFGQIVRGLEQWAKEHSKQTMVHGMALWHEAFDALV